MKNAGQYASNHLSMPDYYDEGAQIQGAWQGKLAAHMGLSGTVAQADFKALADGNHPGTDQALYGNRKPESVACEDWQCSAPKSVSVMAVMVDERLKQAHQDAVSAAFAELEARAGVRSGQDRHTETTGNLLCARYEHDASRSLDPQLHSHCVIFNVTQKEDGSLRGLTNADMVQDIRFAGKAYQNALARNCRDLGYDLDMVQDAKGQTTGFEIRGISERVLTKFSKRSTDIEAQAALFEKEHHRLPSKAERDIITRETRDRKLTEITTSEVLARQWNELTPEEARSLRDTHSQAHARGAALQPSIDAQAAVKWAIEHHSERQQAFRGAAVIADALNQNLGGVDLHAIKAAAAASDELVQVDGLRLVTTRTAIAREQKLVQSVNVGRGGSDALAPDFAAFKDQTDAGWNEQRAAVQGILRSQDRIVALRGAPGAGKTTAMQELDQGLQSNGRSAVWLGTTAKAVEALQSSGGIKGQTLESWLNQAERGGARRGSVVVVDEAGMLGAKDGNRLFAAAEKMGARVVLVGDSKQLAAVSAGDTLATLEKHSGLQTFELNTIRRQQREHELQAAKAFARHDVQAGVEALDKGGSLRVDVDYIGTAAASYLQHRRGLAAQTAGDGKAREVIGSAPTWREVDQFNRIVRAELKASGTLGQEERQFSAVRSHNLTAAQKRKTESYRPGAVVWLPGGQEAGAVRCGQYYEVAAQQPHAGRVVLTTEGGKMSVFNPQKDGAKVEVGESYRLGVRVGEELRLRANDRQLGVINGDKVRVVGFEGEKLVAQKMGSEKKILLDANRYRSVVPAYASTVHGVQGETATHSVCFGAQWSKRGLTVGATRGKQGNELHTPSRERLEAVAVQTGAKLGALDALAEKNFRTAVAASSVRVAALEARQAPARTAPKTAVAKGTRGKETNRQTGARIAPVATPPRQKAKGLER